MPINRNEPLNDRWYDPTSLMDRSHQEEILQCPNCKGHFFEQVPVHQFPKMHNVILGQAVQPYQGITFHVFRCIKCHEVYEPSVQHTTRDHARKIYDSFLDEMESPPVQPKKPTTGDPEVI